MSLEELGLIIIFIAIILMAVFVWVASVVYCYNTMKMAQEKKDKSWVIALIFGSLILLLLSAGILTIFPSWFYRHKVLKT